ncbi:MAG TPA: hypothetical protein VF679_09960 [Pedobacter sp.]
MKIYIKDLRKEFTAMGPTQRGYYAYLADNDQVYYCSPADCTVVEEKSADVIQIKGEEKSLVDTIAVQKPKRVILEYF